MFDIDRGVPRSGFVVWIYLGKLNQKPLFSRLTRMVQKDTVGIIAADIVFVQHMALIPVQGIRGRINRTAMV